MTKPKTPKPPGERRDVATRFQPGTSGSPATQFKVGHPAVPGPAFMTDLTDEITAALADETRKTSFRGACNRVGVLVRTAQKWRARGERERLEGIDSVFARFSVAIDRARGEQELELVEGAKNGTLPERVGLFLLERVHQQTYQPKQTLEVEGHVEHSDVRRRLEAKLIRDLDATTIDGSVLAVDEPAPPRDPLALPELGRS